MSKLVRIVAVVACALALAAAAEAASTRDARSLALSAHDFPAHATRTSQRERRAAALPGGTGQVYTTTFSFAKRSGHELVTSTVVVAQSRKVARAAYAALVADAKSDVDRALTQRRLGDEQYTGLFGRPGVDEAAAAVWVRVGVVVWSVSVTMDVTAGAVHMTAAQALADLNVYANKQRLRIGD